MRKRVCDSRCWWATGKKCECICEGKQHGILWPQNAEKFNEWAEGAAEVWHRRQIIRDNE